MRVSCDVNAFDERDRTNQQSAIALRSTCLRSFQIRNSPLLYLPSELRLRRNGRKCPMSRQRVIVSMRQIDDSAIAIDAPIARFPTKFYHADLPRIFNVRRTSLKTTLKTRRDVRPKTENNHQTKTWLPYLVRTYIQHVRVLHDYRQGRIVSYRVLSRRAVSEKMCLARFRFTMFDQCSNQLNRCYVRRNIDVTYSRVISSAYRIHRAM